MFSSNHPIPGFNRPASLYVIDGVVNVPIELDVSIETKGTTPSLVTDVRLLVLHDEYERFEIVNMTEPLNSVSGASSGTVKFQFTPTYAGNHSLQVNILSATPDDNPSNDERNSRMTVGASYWNCDTLQNWTATGEWSLSTDTSISFGTSCHVGNGDASTYSANSISRLTSPTLNLPMGSRLGPARWASVSFTPGALWLLTDVVEAKTSTGAWEELIGYSGTVDQDFLTDGASWNTFSIESGGHVSPVIPLAPARHLRELSVPVDAQHGRERSGHRLVDGRGRHSLRPSRAVRSLWRSGPRTGNNGLYQVHGAALIRESQRRQHLNRHRSGRGRPASGVGHIHHVHGRSQFLPLDSTSSPGHRWTSLSASSQTPTPRLGWSR